MKSLFFSLCLGFYPFSVKASGGKSRKIVYAQIATHPSLNQIKDGFERRLKELGFSEPWAKVIYYNAQGDSVVANTIASQMIGEKPDVLVTVTTPMSQVVAGKKSPIPMVFTAVNDPVKAKLLLHPEHPEGHITGIYHINPVERHLNLIREVLPKAKTLGIIYSSGEINSAGDALIFKEEAKKLSFLVIEKTIVNTSQLAPSAKELAQKVDAIYFPTDNKVVSSVEVVLKACEERGIPAFSADRSSVEKGALMTESLDHHHIGRITAESVVDLLQGKKINDLPVKTPTQFELVINAKTAKKLKIDLPKTLVDRKPIIL